MSSAVPDVPTREDVQGWIAMWFVGGLLSLATYVLGGFAEVGGVFVDGIETVLGILDDTAATVGDVPLEAIDTVADVVASTAAAAGPFAPIVIALTFAVVVYGLYTTAEWLIRVFPFL